MNLQMKEEVKKGLRVVILIVMIVFVSKYTENYYDQKNLKEGYAKDVRKMMVLLMKISFSKNLTSLNMYKDSCISYFKACPSEETDSLKNGVSYYIKFNDDFTSDIINSIKDSGTTDTSNLFRSKTLIEMKKVCTLVGEDYSNFKISIDNAAINLQEKQNEMTKSRQTTNLLRDNLVLSRKRGDSILQELYNNMFISKR
jgi:hypothetical protein